MQAIITIDYRHYLVPDAKKALAFAEFLGKARLVYHPELYDAKTIQVHADPPEVSVETVKAGITIKKRGGKDAA